MADIRIKDLATTATTTASDDFMAVDGAINGTRKLSAATPAFLTSVTTPTLTSPAATPLTLGTGTSGAAITVLSASNNVGIGTTTPNRTLTVNGLVGINNGVANTQQLVLEIDASGAYFTSSYVGSAAYVPIRLWAGGSERILIASTNGDVSISSTTAASSGVGALIVQGGISAGNTGAASYFGGAVTVSGALSAATFSLASSEGQIATINSTAANGPYVTFLASSVAAGDIGSAANVFGAGTSTDFGVNSRGTTLYLGQGNSVRATLSSTGATFAGTVIAPAATASLAPLRIPHGTAPTSPTDGDMWTTTAGLFIRINGVTKTVTLL